MERMRERLINLSVVILGLLFMGFNSGLSAEETMNELLPNGSFEWVEYLSPGWVEHNKSKFGLPGEDPILPATWNLDKPGKFIMESANGIPHTGKYAFTIMPGRTDWRETQISCGWIEVRPQDTYHISGFARGMGSLHFYLDRQKPEGIDGELLGKIDLNDSWQELSFTRRFPGNISQIKLIITVVGDKESIFATIDDVSITTTDPNTTPVPFLGVAPKNDEDTVLIDHYDGNFHALASPYGQITFIEGRFGKAIHSGKQAGVDYPNEKIIVPEIGTVEFWFSPDLKRKEGAGLFFVHSGWARLYIEWKPDVGLAGAWDINHKPFSKVNAGGEEWIRRWSDKDWHHISLCWGKEAFRLYVDGLLVSIDTDFSPAQTIGPVIAVTPHGGVEETYNVGIDELRISRSMRYGLSRGELTPYNKTDTMNAPDRTIKASALCDEGISLQREGKMAEAEIRFKSAIAEDPNYGMAYALLGEMYQDQKQYQESEMMYRKQIEVHPDGTTGWNNLGRLYVLQKRWHNASEAFQRSLEINWNQPDIIEALRGAREEVKELDEQ